MQRIYIVSYPKSGRTWLRYSLAVLEAWRTGRPTEAVREKIKQYDRIGEYELEYSHDKVEKLPWQSWESDKADRVQRGYPCILVTRDPRDIMVSFYYHITYRRGSHTTMHGFLTDQLRGFEACCNFMEHWLRLADNLPNVYDVQYEDMHQDYRATMSRLLAWMGIQLSEYEAKKLQDVTSFDEMQKREMCGDFSGRCLGMLGQNRYDTRSYKCRRGMVGEWQWRFDRLELEWMANIMAKYPRVVARQKGTERDHAKNPRYQYLAK